MRRHQSAAAQPYFRSFFAFSKLLGLPHVCYTWSYSIEMEMELIFINRGSIFHPVRNET
ncbi:MAG: hypothetical protein ACSHXG_15660 [Maribacter stanieri]